MVLNKIKQFPLNNLGIKIKPNSKNKNRKDDDQLMILLCFVFAIDQLMSKEIIWKRRRTIRGVWGNTNKAQKAKL